MRTQYFFRPSPQGLHAWHVARLIELSSDLPQQLVPLTEIQELDKPMFDSGEQATWRNVIAHVRLMDEVDPKYPIILSADGAVMDGMHRVARALRLGASAIKAVRFTVDPPPDHIGKGPDDLP